MFATKDLILILKALNPRSFAPLRMTTSSGWQQGRDRPRFCHPEERCLRRRIRFWFWGLKTRFLGLRPSEWQPV